MSESPSRRPAPRLGRAATHPQPPPNRSVGLRLPVAEPAETAGEHRGRKRAAAVARQRQRSLRGRRQQTAGLQVVAALLAGYALVVWLLRTARHPGRWPGAKRVAARALGAGLALVILLLALWLTSPALPVAPVSEEAPPPRAEELQEGQVLSVESMPLAGGAPATLWAGELGQAAAANPMGTVMQVRVTRGSQRGREVRIESEPSFLPGRATAGGTYRPGDRVVVSYMPDLDTAAARAAPPDGSRGPFLVVDHVRRPWLVWGAALLVLTVVAVAGGEGLRALVGLASAVGVLWWFVVPRLLVGQPPVLIALVGAALIAIPSLLLTRGIGRGSLVPLGGIGGSLALVGVLTAGAVRLARLSGLAANEEISLVYVGTQGVVDPQGLLLAGMLIGVIGGLVDVTVGQAAAVFEFHDVDPSASRRELFRRGMSVGRAHVAACVHTLVLAYAGAALPMLMLFALYAAQLGDVWNREMIVAEALRSLAGTIGLAAAMPLTTWLASLACRPSFLSQHSASSQETLSLG